ncbi:MAG: hypothetical protein WCL11_19905 [Verrucomicrobiota bacterium]
MNTRKAFLRSLVKIAAEDGKPLSARRATRAFRKALLDFGSETEDNQSCAAEIGVGTVRGRDRCATGLALQRYGRLVSQVLNDAEGTPVPEAVRKHQAGITQQEWDAVLRLATLVFISLERER